MYEELVKRLREESEIERWLQPHSANETPKLLDDAADAIEELQEDSVPIDDMEMILSEVAKPRWIPVRERLPEIDEKHHCSKDVLVYLDVGYMAFSALEENIFGQIWFECERHSDVEEEMKVTHWMPLPEPPKEE